MYREKRIGAVTMALLLILLMVIPSVSAEAGRFPDKGSRYDNGTYRGSYEDGGIQQVSIQFQLENNHFNNISFRHLFYKDVDYRKISEDHPSYPVVLQHQQIIKYLEGRPVEAMAALYNPGVIASDVDGFSGATLRGSKILSAIQDGLNRGIYNPDSPYNNTLSSYENGTYRGVFWDGGIQQVSIQFDIANDVIQKLSFRHLFYKDTDYRQIKEGHAQYPVVLQHQQMLEHLEGKPLKVIFDLYKPEDFINDLDGFTGATLRANKVLYAIRDALNRGPYKPVGESIRDLGFYKDGTYRGVFSDGGNQQVSIQFDVKDNRLDKLSFRHLFYKDTDYRQIKEGHEKYPVSLQHQQILEYLEGKPIEAILDLYSPEDMVDTVDGFTGATIRGGKVLSAVKDGLNRGRYSLPPTEGFVERLYSAALNRASDDKGMSHFAKGLAEGRYTAARVVGFILLEAPEFANQNLGDADFIDTAYKALLNRHAEPAGAEFWLSKLKEGYSRKWVIAQIMQAPTEEFQKICNRIGVVPGKIYLSSTDYPKKGK